MRTFVGEQFVVALDQLAGQLLTKVDASAPAPMRSRHCLRMFLRILPCGNPSSRASICGISVSAMSFFPQHPLLFYCQQCYSFRHDRI
jgi:hypothetical protein